MNVDLALSLVIALINNASQISQLIQTAKSQNRDITAAELQALFDADEVARANLVLAISAAKGK